MIDERVAKLETEQARQGERLGRIERDVTSVAEGVSKLLERDAQRPDGLTWKTIAATCGSIVAVAYVVWWLIGSSPAVVEHGRRLDRLDDPQVGRVHNLERRMDKLDGWHATVRR